MFRKFLKFMAGAMFVVLFVPTVLALISVNRVLSSGYYNSAAVNAGLYDVLAAVALTEVKLASSEYTDSNASPNSQDKEIADLTDKVINEVVPTLFEPAFIEQVASKNISNFLAYINNQADDLLVYIPKQELETRMLGAIEILFNDVLSETLDLPTCTPQQLEKFYGNVDISKLECVPDFVKSGDLDFSTASDDFKQEFLGQFAEFFEGEDEVPLSQPLDDYDTEVQPNLEILQEIVSQTQIGLLVGLIVLVGLLASYFVLSTGPIVVRFRATTIPVSIAGILTTIVAVGVLLVTALMFSYASTQTTQAGDVVIEAYYFDFVQQLTNGIFIPYLAVGVGMIGLGIGSWWWIGRNYKLQKSFATK